MVNKVHFGKRISVLRRKVGLSQTDLAEKLGVTSQAVSKWEYGNAIPDIDILLELSYLYKVTINEMLEDVDLLCELTGKETGCSGINRMPYSSAEHPDQGDWIEFGHTMGDYIGGQIACGFVITGYVEDQQEDITDLSFMTKATKL